MKKHIFMYLLAVVTLLCGCTQEQMDSLPTSDLNQAANSQGDLSNMVVLVVNQLTSSNERVGYVMYDTQENKYSSLTEDEYDLLWTCANIVANGDADIQTRGGAASPRWHSAGQGSSALDAISIANNLKSRIPKGHDFEIKVVYSSDKKHFTVYWRLI